MIKRLSIIAAGLLSLCIGSVQAEEDAINRFNQFVAEVNEYQAQFKQTVVDSNGNIIEEADGEFFLSRPGKFRWDYVTPYAQQIVADGQRIWFYDEDLEQITVNAQDAALADSPAGLLSGRSMPEDAFNFTAIDKADELQWVELTPKDDQSNFQRVQLGFDEIGLQQMLMIDAFDQRTQLLFTQVQINPEIDASRFKFTPPAGVDVVGEAQ